MATSVTPIVTIKQCVSAEGHPFSEHFIEYAGKSFYSRSWVVTPSNQHVRAALAQGFLDRLKRFPSTILALDSKFEADMASIALLMKEPLSRVTGSQKSPHGGYPGASKKRPALSIVEQSK